MVMRLQSVAPVVSLVSFRIVALSRGLTRNAPVAFTMVSRARSVAGGRRSVLIGLSSLMSVNWIHLSFFTVSCGAGSPLYLVYARHA